jgi:hypothetical protein
MTLIETKTEMKHTDTTGGAESAIAILLVLCNLFGKGKDVEKV